MTEPGWYHADNDPPGTVRYWDGVNWTSDPVAQPGAMPSPPVAGGYGPAGALSRTGPSGSALASPGVRIGARAIDFVIGSLLFGIFIVSDIGGSSLFRPSNGNGYSFTLNDRALDTSTEFFVLGVFLIAWHALWTHLAGGTPGKLMTGICVADAATGKVPVSLQKAALRAANYLNFVVIAVSLSLNGTVALFVLGLNLISLILLFVDTKHRTVMDLIAKTVVVKKNQSGGYDR